MKLTKLDLEILKKAKRAEGEPALVTEAGVGTETLFARAVTDLAAAQGLMVRMFRALLDGERVESDRPSLCEHCGRDAPEGCACSLMETWLTWDGKVLACRDYSGREPVNTMEGCTVKTREQRRARRRAAGNVAYTAALLMCIALLLWKLSV